MSSLHVVELEKNNFKTGIALVKLFVFGGKELCEGNHVAQVRNFMSNFTSLLVGKGVKWMAFFYFT